jgi:hypothetical protein
MSELLIPIGLTVAALFAAMAAYRGIRRGSARFYSLERESILRRAGFTLFAAVFLFLAAIALLVYNQQQLTTVVEEPAAATVEDGEPTFTPTPGVLLESVPPTNTPTATPDPNAPQPTPTPFIRRGIIEGTGGSGAYLRDGAGVNTNTIEVLDDGAILTLIDSEPPVEADGFTWLKVRTIAGDEGWVADLYLAISAR